MHRFFFFLFKRERERGTNQIKPHWITSHDPPQSYSVATLKKFILSRSYRIVWLLEFRLELYKAVDSSNDL